MKEYVVAYHLIISAYGFWLPNDPRGSWSDFVRAFELYRAGGKATRTHEHRSVAKKPHDRAKRIETKTHLAHRAVRFTRLQARAIANGFSDYCRRSGCVIYACAIMPDHVHCVVERFRYSIEKISHQLRAAATTSLHDARLHPFADTRYPDRRSPSPWSRGEWSVFLGTSQDVNRAIKYVENNPTRDGLKPQQWKFVTPYRA
jgi:REP element-mobilizing transposase RayT